MGKKLLAGDVDAVRTAAAHVAVVDVQHAGSEVGVQSYRFVPSSWYSTCSGQCVTQRGISSPNLCRKVLTRSCSIAVAVVKNATCACLMAGGVGEDVTLCLWASGSRRFEGFPHGLIEPTL